MTEPLPPDLAELIAAERAAPLGNTAVRASVRAAIASKVGAAPLGTSAAGLGALGKTLAVLAITIGSGTAALVYSRSSNQGAAEGAVRQPPIERVVTATAPIETTASRVASVTLEPDAPPPAERVAPRREPIAMRAAVAKHAAAPSIERIAAPDEATPADELTALPDPAPNVPAQAELLRRATTALGAGDAAAALELARQDRAHHPDGVLAEERAALEIRALAMLGRDADARAAAFRFFTNYPDSVHRAVLERALRPHPHIQGEP